METGLFLKKDLAVFKTHWISAQLIEPTSKSPERFADGGRTVTKRAAYDNTINPHSPMIIKP